MLNSNITCVNRKVYQSKRPYLAGILAMVWLGVCPDLVFAQSVLEEVIVTATKRGEVSMQDIATSITAVNAKTLENMAAVEFVDISRSIAGLDVIDLGPSNKRYVTRGINSAGEAQTSLYFDNVSTSGVGLGATNFGDRQLDLLFFDIEQVEVLRGPQGTLYGSNSQSGVVRIVSKKPNVDAVEAEIATGLSFTETAGENTRFNGMVNIPLIEGTLAVRAVGYGVMDDGFIDNLSYNETRVNDSDTYGARLSAAWNISDDTSILAQFMFQDLDVNGKPEHTPFSDTIGFTTFPAQPELNSVARARDEYDDKTIIFAATLEHAFDWADLTVAVSNFDRDVLDSEDISNSFDFIRFLQAVGVFPPFPVPAAGQLINDMQTELFSTEVRLSSNLDGPVQGVLGFYHSNRDIFLRSDGLEASLVTGRTISGGTIVSSRTFTNTTKEYAVFGELTYDITEQITLLGGFRWFKTDRVNSAETFQPFFGLGAVGPEPTVENKGDDVIFKAQISYDLTETALAYFQYAQGFRAGGTNAGTIAAVPLTYGPDFTENFELGLKSTWLDDRVLFNMAIYQMNLQDLQVAQRFGPGGAFGGVGNSDGDTAKSIGVEIETQFVVNDSLTLFTSGNYTDAELTVDLPGVGAGAVDGAPISRVPNFGFTVAGEYSFPIPYVGGMDGLFRVDYQHVGKQKLTDYVSDFPIDDYGVLNFNLSVQAQKWGARFIVRNATDERPELAVIRGPNNPIDIVTMRPRTIGLELNYKFY